MPLEVLYADILILLAESKVELHEVVKWMEVNSFTDEYQEKRSSI